MRMSCPLILGPCCTSWSSREPPKFMALGEIYTPNTIDISSFTRLIIMPDSESWKSNLSFSARFGVISQMFVLHGPLTLRRQSFRQTLLICTSKAYRTAALNSTHGIDYGESIKTAQALEEDCFNQASSDVGHIILSNISNAAVHDHLY